ncbi:hypothetical protein B0H11DRAFT_2184608 [Mycena galericulata]|nr:hypothetical protein B0H11DRAFT_2184608 [Mycena galericulata]
MGREEPRDFCTEQEAAEFTSDVGKHARPVLGPSHNAAGEDAVADGGGQLNLMPSRAHPKCYHAELEAIEPHLFSKFSLQMLGWIQNPRWRCTGCSKSQRLLESGQERQSRSQVCLLVWRGSKKLQNEVKATGSTGAKAQKKELPRSKKKSLRRRLRVE